MLFAVAYCMVYTHAQQPYFREFGPSDGLPSIQIYDLYVAKSGLLYLGTDKGLYSFDGISYKKYEFVESLAVGVDGIIEDEQGRIWCKNFSSQIFYTSGSRLLLDTLSSKILNKTDVNLTDFTVYDGSLFVATELTLYEVKADGRIQTHYKLGRGSEAITSVAIHPKSKALLLATTSNLITLSKSGIHKKKQFNSQVDFYTYSGEVYAIQRVIENLILDSNQRPFRNLNNADLGTFIKLSTANGRLWLCTTSGVYQLDSKSRTIGAPLITKFKTTDIVSDREGNIWVSTLGRGLIFIPNEHLTEILLEGDERGSKVLLTCLNQDEQGNIYAGTSDGRIFEINPSRQLVFEYSTGGINEIEFIHVKQDVIYCSQGIFRKHHKEPLGRFYLGKTIAEDDLGNILLGTYNLSGITTFDSKSSPRLPDFLVGKLKSTLYSQEQRHIFILKSKRTRAVYFDKNSKSYYSGNSDGLFLFSPVFSKNEIRDEKGNPIIATDIRGDKDGNIWVATIQQGLWKIRGDKVVFRLHQGNGLPSNQCKKMRISGNDLWLITDAGLHKINTKTMEVNDVSASSGLNGLMIADLEISQSSIYLATNNGLLVTGTSEIVEQTMPLFRIERALAANQTVQQNSRLKHNQNNLSIRLQTVHFRSLGNYIYEYRLRGAFDEWRMQDGKIRDINFLSLEPGNYTFEARVRMGIIKTPIERLSFSIAMPYWNTYWFLTIFSLLLVVLVYLIFRWQFAKIRTRQAIREQLALSQITALRTQMNPHFLFNILNAFQGLIYSNQKTKANEYLGVFSDLMRKVLDISDKREISIYEELESIELYVELEKARFNSGENETSEFEFLLLIENREQLKNYFIPPLILQPYIENAIKHGLLHKEGAKILRVALSRENEKYWRVEIEDNGIGRERSMERNRKFQKHTSFATRAIDRRIELINKLNVRPIFSEIIDLKNNQNHPVGTRVVLHIPVKMKTNESNNSR